MSRGNSAAGEIPIDERPGGWYFIIRKLNLGLGQQMPEQRKGQVMAKVIVGMSGGALATGEPDIDTLVNGSAAYVYGQVSVPQVASIGGEWAVLGLARAGYAVPQSWYDGYYTRVEQYVQECGGVLHPKKYTEYSRLLVALSSIGKDGRDVAGYDLTTALGDYRKTIWQGNNGPIWALMALDSANYPMPVNEAASVQATRQMYIDLILSVQMADGGWVLDNTVYTVSDPDMTGMALQALAKYTDQPAVASAVERGLDCISNMIKNRNLLTYTATTSESIDQVLVALCELGVDYRQNKYMKNGTNLLDALLQFRNANGSFKHDSAGTGDNQMSAEQGLYTLAAVKRFLNGQNSLYRMTDVLDLGGRRYAAMQQRKRQRSRHRREWGRKRQYFRQHRRRNDLAEQRRRIRQRREYLHGCQHGQRALRRAVPCGRGVYSRGHPQ